MELVGSVGGEVHVLKKPGVRKNMNSVFRDFSCANVNSEAKTGKVVREEGDSSLGVSPGFKYECTVVYIENVEGIKERVRCEIYGSIDH